jgi:RNA polymerase sigma factor (sigma-70 family)
MSEGLHQTFHENRQQLLRYLKGHGAGDEAEDLLQELWIKLTSAPTGPVGSPRNYIFRAATNLMIDRRRSDVQDMRRAAEWVQAEDRLPDAPANDPGPERDIDSRRKLALVNEALRKLPERALQIFRQHRIDGLKQREIREQSGLSQSTIESDLRMVYRLLDDLREKLDGV